MKKKLTSNIFHKTILCLFLPSLGVALTDTKVLSDSYLDNQRDNFENCEAIGSNGSIINQLNIVMKNAIKNKNIQANEWLNSSTYSTFRSFDKEFLPKFNLSLSNSYYRVPIESKSYDGDKYVYNDYTQSYADINPTVTMSWKLFDDQANKLKEYYRYSYQSGIFNTESTKISEILKASNDYINYLKLSSDLEVGRSLSTLYDEHIKVTKALLKAGQVSQLDVISAESELIDYRVKVNSLESQVDSLRNNLKTSIYKEICPHKISKLNISNVVIPSKRTISDNLMVALTKSPLIKSYNEQIKAQEYMSKSYRNLPSISLDTTLNYDAQFGDISGGASNEYLKTNAGAISANISWDFFDGGTNKAKSNSALRVRESLKKRLQQEKIEITNDFDYIADRIYNLKNSFLLAKDSRDLLSKQVDLVRKGYKAGFKSSLDLRSATSSFYTSSITLSTLWASLLQELLNYESNIMFPSYPAINKQFHTEDNPIITIKQIPIQYKLK